MGYFGNAGGIWNAFCAKVWWKAVGNADCVFLRRHIYRASPFLFSFSTITWRLQQDQSSCLAQQKVYFLLVRKPGEVKQLCCPQTQWSPLHLEIILLTESESSVRPLLNTNNLSLNRSHWLWAPTHSSKNGSSNGSCPTNSLLVCIGGFSGRDLHNVWQCLSLAWTIDCLAKAKTPMLR